MSEEGRIPDIQGTLPQSAEGLAASKDLSVPKDVAQDLTAPKIPGYVLVSPLGKGAYAQVWKAWQVRTRKWVAVKVFTQRGGVNWLFLQREVERLIRLDKHPHIVSLLDADLTGDPAYYVMDLMEGGSLEQFVGGSKPPTSADVAARWMEEIAQALAYVHAKGLIHCDLKPANVMLDDEDHIRVADFGQSRIVTESSGALGTLFYMAPEQAAVLGEGEPVQPDVRWDVYGLGTTMHAVLTGKVPYGEEENIGRIEAAQSLPERLKTYREIAAGPLADCSTLTEGRTDIELSATIGRCASWKAGERHSTMAEVLADLAARRENGLVSALAGRIPYRIRKFIERYSLISRGAALFFILLGLGFLARGWGLLEPPQLRKPPNKLVSTSEALRLLLDSRVSLESRSAENLAYPRLRFADEKTLERMLEEARKSHDRKREDAVLLRLRLLRSRETWVQANREVAETLESLHAHRRYLDETYAKVRFMLNLPVVWSLLAVLLMLFIVLTPEHFEPRVLFGFGLALFLVSGIFVGLVLAGNKIMALSILLFVLILLLPFPSFYYLSVLKSRKALIGLYAVFWTLLAAAPGFAVAMSGDAAGQSWLTYSGFATIFLALFIPGRAARAAGSSPWGPIERLFVNCVRVLGFAGK